MKNKIKKFVVVGLTMISTLAQIGCEGKVELKLGHCKFRDPTINYSDSNLYELDTGFVNFGSSISDTSIQLGHNNLSLGKVPTRKSPEVQKKFNQVVIDSLDPSIHWNGTVSLIPIQISEDDHKTNVEYAYQVDLTSSEGFVKLQGTVHAALDEIDNDERVSQ